MTNQFLVLIPTAESGLLLATRSGIREDKNRLELSRVHAGSLFSFTMFKHSRLFSSCFLFLIFSSSSCQLLYQQTPWLLSNHSRPSWLTLPVSNPTKSFWIDQPGANPLAHEGSTGALGFGDEDIDVCVIGSGITGISAVYHLQRLLSTQGIDKKVVVLEAREFCERMYSWDMPHIDSEKFQFAFRLWCYRKEWRTSHAELLSRFRFPKKSLWKRECEEELCP